VIQFKKIILALLAFNITFLNANLTTSNTQTYREEFDELERIPEYRLMFDGGSLTSLRLLQITIKNREELNFIQRLMSSFGGAALVTPETAPKLYGYVSSVCSKANVNVPLIFLGVSDGYLNAAAKKLLLSSGAIVLEKGLVKTATDEELEAVIAHEIGHIKYNHVNRTIAWRVSLLTTTAIAFAAAVAKEDGRVAAIPAAMLLWSMFTSKSLEKQADRFAYETMDKGEGLIKFFRHVLQQRQKVEDDFLVVHNSLERCQSKMGFFSYLDAKSGYDIARFSYSIDKFVWWIHENTFLGSHPSPEKRIKAVEKYLESKAA
jgi:Zn-dependent protease with chaperone function